jgi:hypothetical protein
MDDLKEIKEDVKELLKQSAVHNELLRTHEARSLALQKEQERLEERIVPIAQHVAFVSVILKGIGLISVGAVAQLLIRSLI